MFLVSLFDAYVLLKLKKIFLFKKSSIPLFPGSVMKIDWSPDGRVLALSWAGGGLSIWSVFGACLVCTLASDRAYTYDGSPVVQGIFKSMVSQDCKVR